MADEVGHILVVDDNRMNRLTLMHGVQQLGHTVTVAESGSQALDMIHDQPVDAVLLDIVMPEMDGFEVLSRLKGDLELRDIPVIIISALDEMESAARAIELGAEDYLAKPFNSTLLRARLNASLEKKRYRDLERAYLEQEMMLHQTEKLATLGKLSAGMAHELNNPAAAAQRSAGQLTSMLDELAAANLQLAEHPFTAGQRDLMSRLITIARERGASPTQLDPLLASDREQVIEQALNERSVREAWQHAAALSGCGVTLEELQPAFETFTDEQLAAVIVELSATCSLHGAIGNIRNSLDRVNQIVAALKAYSYMDQAPVQLVDIHEGLDNTLVMLRATLNDNITIQTRYEPEMPRIEGYGSELNQVWTNILQNAVSAVEAGGQITISTKLESPWAVIDFHDSGVGIPAEIQSRVFDPFFTTRPPGSGAGLGLTISHNIIVQKHHGQIALSSEPGNTCIQVRLPIDGHVE
jgi:signal transduction histidine kinase